MWGCGIKIRGQALKCGIQCSRKDWEPHTNVNTQGAASKESTVKRRYNTTIIERVAGWRYISPRNKVQSALRAPSLMELVRVRERREVASLSRGLVIGSSNFLLALRESHRLRKCHLLFSHTHAMPSESYLAAPCFLHQQFQFCKNPNKTESYFWE